MSSKTFKIAMPEGLDTHDTSPPPLPSWLKGFCVTSKAPSDVRRAGLEVCNLLADGFFKLSYDDVSVPRSMVKPGETEVPYDTAEAILVPGSPGTIFVALRPDNTTVDPVLLARALIEEADHVGAEGWTKTAHTQRIIPVESIAPEMDYLQLAKQIVSQRFPEIQPQLEPKKSFAVRYEEHSPALHLNSAEVQKAVADLVPDSYTVNLENPDLTILMVVAGGSVMMSVVEGYEKLHRFHIHSASYVA
jgi:tRNA(Ser,Leu) C12 N-acetylase TAN1|tara:strand:+ start:16945 stop:17685 length:741 start_codon:yes stop_codon:yes gene_type:complete